MNYKYSKTSGSLRETVTDLFEVMKTIKSFTIDELQGRHSITIDIHEIDGGEEG